MLLAITSAISRSLERCELTHLEREPIDVGRARAQHRDYEEALSRLGVAVLRLPESPEQPDAVFVEDVAVVLPELALLTRPGAPSRQPEVERMALALAPYRPLARINAPGTLDGGDVLVIGRRIFVGLSSRTNAAGVEQLAAFTAPHAYRVEAVAVTGCLHLKSAVTALAEGAVLLNPLWIDSAIFRGWEVTEVDPSEPAAANALAVGGKVLFPTAYPGTRGRLAARGFDLVPIDASELAKAEGALTCCSVIFEAAG